MWRTRREIAVLLKQAAGDLKKTQQIHGELESLMEYIGRVLEKKPAPKPSPSAK
jgi:hypothetical protein